MKPKFYSTFELYLTFIFDKIQQVFHVGYIMSDHKPSNSEKMASQQENSNSDKKRAQTETRVVSEENPDSTHTQSSPNQQSTNKEVQTPESSKESRKKDTKKESIGFRSFAKNMIFGESDPQDKEKENTSSLFGTVLETGDKAKSEMVKMFGREVRNYLNALEIGKDVHNLLTNYSLEISASIHLKPLAEKKKEREQKKTSIHPKESNDDE